MMPVILETPYAGADGGRTWDDPDVQANLAYTRACLRDCLLHGEAPFASHVIYTQPDVLHDGVPEEREAGIQAGFAWRHIAHKTVVYTDMGISPGMLKGIAHARELEHEVVYRTLGKLKISDAYKQLNHDAANTDLVLVREGDRSYTVTVKRK